MSHLALNPSLRSVLSLLKTPLLSTIVMFPGLTPASIIILATAMFAAPAPSMQIIEYLEALGLRDIFQIDSSERRLQPSDRVLYFSWNFCSKTDRIGVHAS